MPRIVIDVDSDLTPERVLAAATDFSDNRLKLWPNISAKYWKVNQVTETSADVVEGTDVMGGVWAHEIYDWSQPGTVVGTAQESNVFKPGGTWTMTVTPRDGGSHITIVNDRHPGTLKGRMAALVMSMAGKRILTKHLRKTLDIITTQPVPVSAPAAPAPSTEPAPPSQPPISETASTAEGGPAGGEPPRPGPREGETPPT